MEDYNTDNTLTLIDVNDPDYEDYVEPEIEFVDEDFSSNLVGPQSEILDQGTGNYDEIENYDYWVEGVCVIFWQM